jgi:hypothetical protein
LKKRAPGLTAPIQMCDALSRNTPKGVATLLANCLAHGRRQVVDVVDNFPEECRYVLETLGGVYHYDALAREQELSPEQRLRFHQEHSGPSMTELHDWMETQLAEHKTEPNSGLGKAISYLLNHWTKLTVFLWQPGAPIDNNIVERALKKAILNRKNAFFYKTLNGAGVGDLFMSLILNRLIRLYSSRAVSFLISAARAEKRLASRSNLRRVCRAWRSRRAVSSRARAASSACRTPGKPEGSACSRRGSAGRVCRLAFP